MKLGIMIDKAGIFLFKVLEDNNVITKSYVQKNMLGWLFHDSNIYDYISLLPIEKYVVSYESDIPDALIEITEKEAQQIYLSLVTFQDKKQKTKSKGIFNNKKI